ncbi:MAG TPA: CT253 family lipoprotein [Chlamydiales bacterium]|nr:CT253 family lipoprotein [Chlamydiales bacterium]
MRSFAIRYTSLFALFLTAGCFTHRLGDPVATRFHDDGRAKPIAVIPTMIDTTSFDVPWSIAEELTNSIVQAVGTSGQIYIKPSEEFAVIENPFGGDLSWTKTEFSGQQFAVFLELVEHELTPVASQKSQEEPRGHYLHMGVRVRVIDIRGEEPKIVLQEVVRDSYYIPKSFFPPNYQITCWGCDEYVKTPLGIAHARLAQEVSGRVTDYILLAQNR